MDEITFLCSFPPVQSAIKITGTGDGMRIQLDIPESEMHSAAWLLQMRECILEVTVKKADGQEKSGNIKRTAKY